MSKLTLNTLKLLAISLVIIGVRPAHADTRLQNNTRSWLMAVQLEQEIEVTTQQVEDIEKFDNVNTGPVKYDATGEVFSDYNSIKSALGSKKETLEELKAEYFALMKEG